MSSPASPSLPIRQALDHCEPLDRLSRRMRESRQRLEAVAPLLPASMHPMVSAGPIDAQGWTLLAENGAVAAKLRHMVPALEARLQSLGWPALPLRVRVLAAQ